jgi:hypothetical protein
MKVIASITVIALCSTIALVAQEDSPLMCAAKIGAAKRRQLSVEREKLLGQIKTLQEEREKMAEQADQPYSEDGNEDQTAKRLAGIQKELAEAERKLNPPQ